MAPAVGESENIERIRVLEELKAVCAAVQARETAALSAARGRRRRRGGTPRCGTNASGLCQRCNLTKEADHWRHHATADHLDVTTPTGHTYHAPTRALLPRALPGTERTRLA